MMDKSFSPLTIGGGLVIPTHHFHYTVTNVYVTILTLVSDTKDSLSHGSAFNHVLTNSYLSLTMSSLTATAIVKSIQSAIQAITIIEIAYISLIR